MAEQQLIGALEAGGTKMVCATGYADGTVLKREQIATTTPQETVEAVNAWFADKGIAALGIGAFGPTAVNPASPQYGKILETPKTAWRYFCLLYTSKAQARKKDQKIPSRHQPRHRRKRANARQSCSRDNARLS